MNPLKAAGVPLGARIVFRLQHLGWIVGALLMVPGLFVWGLVHPSGLDAIDRMMDLMDEREHRIRVQKMKLIRMYSKEGTDK